MNDAESNSVSLREVTASDLPIFFAQQRDPVALRMAAFTVQDPHDEAAFTAHWQRILNEDSITARTILYKGSVAGHVAGFVRFGQPEVTYWLGREFWGEGIATRALAALLAELPVRPLYALAAKDNIASRRVLEKCGFRVTGEDKGFANARGVEVEEFIFVLERSVDE